MIRFLVACLMFIGIEARAEILRLAVTTSFHNSGLADVLLPAITADTGIEVQLLVVGTGQAIRLGQAGDVEAILVHSKTAEDAFLKAGYGTHRRQIMFNDFVFVGPASDPANIAKAPDAITALEQIRQGGATFVSRGDDSGTHKKELSLWAAAGAAPTQFGRWYNATGAGMGAALNTAAGLDAYIMADRASWLNFGNKQDLLLLYSGDPILFNQYAFIPVNPKLHTHINHHLAKQVEAWLTSNIAQVLIDGHNIAGEQLFTFNAQR